MKKTILLLFLVLLATTAYASRNVANTRHNLGSTAPAANAFKSVATSTGTDQVCIFCHTPHNAAKTAFLWNKSTPAAGAFKLYSSANLSKTLYDVKLGASSPSLLCLSCHDGTSAINVLHASSLGTDKNATMSGQTDGVAVNIEANLTPFFGSAPGDIGDQTGNLTNDHPIGFDYNAVRTNNISEYKDITGQPTRLFSVADGINPTRTNQVECSTCHDPHIDNTNTPAQSPFLVMSNAGSALCLTCHNK